VILETNNRTTRHFYSMTNIKWGITYEFCSVETQISSTMISNCTNMYMYTATNQISCLQIVRIWLIKSYMWSVPKKLYWYTLWDYRPLINSRG
jgi:hypothetical protein